MSDIISVKVELSNGNIEHVVGESSIDFYTQYQRWMNQLTERNVVVLKNDSTELIINLNLVQRVWVYRNNAK